MQPARIVTSETPPGRRLARFDEIDSTNMEAARRYAAGERGPLWIVAGAQSRGRGRLAGRVWTSPPGNLYSTCLVTLSAPARALGQAGFATALAVVDTIVRLGGRGLDPRLKWPNDVLIGGRKVSGILIESLGGSDADGWTLAIGCGINLAVAPEGTRYPATALAQWDVNTEPQTALAVYAEALEERLAQWEGGRNFETLRRDWSLFGPQEGSEMSVATGAETLHGRFAGLGEGGALRLALEDGGMRELHAGDVVPAAARGDEP